jgi:cytochrome c
MPGIDRRGWTLGLAAASAALASVVAFADAPPDPAKGQDVFQDRCSGCHVLEGFGQGPSLVGVVGRRAGSLPGYAYSAALKSSGIVWTPALLDRFLTGPKKLVPGTAMDVIVPDPAERGDLVAYLATLKAR